MYRIEIRAVAAICEVYLVFSGVVRASQNNAEPLKALGLDEFPPRVSLPITVSF